MAERKTRVYLVEMNDQVKTKRLIAATSPQAARNFACKAVTARMATAMEMYQSKLTLENAPEEPAPAQSSIQMTGGSSINPFADPFDPSTHSVSGGGGYTRNDDLKYAGQP